MGTKLREQIHAFSGELSPRFTKPVQRFIEQMVYGIVVSKDVKLSQISRALEETIAVKKTEDRLSINLGREHLVTSRFKTSHWRSLQNQPVCG